MATAGALAVLAVGGPAGPAAAAPAPAGGCGQCVGAAKPGPGTVTKVTQGYVAIRSFYSARLRMCFRTVIDGSITATHNSAAPGSVWSPYLSNPRVVTSMLSSCGAQGKPVRAGKADITQVWYDHGCTVSPSLGVAFPWQIGLSFTETCGQTEAARASTSTVQGASGVFYQANSGTKVVQWPSLARARTDRVCVDGSVTVTVYSASAGAGYGSDTQRISNLTLCSVRNGWSVENLT